VPRAIKPPSPDRRCQATIRDARSKRVGERCGNHALPGQTYCLAHDPAHSLQKAARLKAEDVMLDRILDEEEERAEMIGDAARRAEARDRARRTRDDLGEHRAVRGDVPYEQRALAQRLDRIIADPATDDETKEAAVWKRANLTAGVETAPPPIHNTWDAADYSRHVQMPDELPPMRRRPRRRRWMEMPTHRVARR
jgi:hypothetical protein